MHTCCYSCTCTSDQGSHNKIVTCRLIVEEIQVLTSKGFTVSIRGENHKFQVGLLVFIADNLPAHALGGFKEFMFFANQICRTYTATTEEVQTHFLECHFELRTVSDHDRHCQLLKGLSCNAHSVAYGINQNSILHRLPNFSVAVNLPHDIMHDVMEGVIPYEMKLLLTHYVTCK